MVRHILNWVDDKMDESIKNEDDHVMSKAFGLGMIEGLVDGLFVFGAVMYPIVVVRNLMKK